MAVARRRPPVTDPLGAVDPLADKPTPGAAAADPLAGLGGPFGAPLGQALVDPLAGLGNVVDPLGAAMGQLAGLGTHPTPGPAVQGLDGLKGAVNADVVRASLGVTGNGPDPVVLAALQDIQVKVSKIDALTKDIGQVSSSYVAMSQTFLEFDKKLGAIQQLQLSMGEVLKDIYVKMQAPVVAAPQNGVATPAAAAAPAGPTLQQQHLKLVNDSLQQMMRDKKKMDPTFALNWKAHGPTIFTALAGAASQGLGKEVTPQHVEQAFTDHGALGEDGFIRF